MTPDQTPTAAGAAPGGLPQLDPNMVLTRVQQSGELGAALVREAVARCYAEHYAAENAELRKQLAGDEPAPAPDAGGSAS